MSENTNIKTILKHLIKVIEMTDNNNKKIIELEERIKFLENKIMNREEN